MYTAIVTSAGSGSRMGLGYNKMFYKILGRTIIEHSVALFLNDIKCSQIIVPTALEDQDMMRDIFKNQRRIEISNGGETRQKSVSNALELVREAVVLVHDGARPRATQAMVDECYDVAMAETSAVVAVPLKDTVKRVSSDDASLVGETIPRESLIAVQTPQAFPISVLKAAHKLAIKSDFIGTDDAQLVERFTEVPIKIVPGDYRNMKFTTPEDIDYFEHMMKKVPR